MEDDVKKEAEVEKAEEKETEDKPNFYDVIKELKKKSKKDKNLSYSDNSNNNSFILNNR